MTNNKIKDLVRHLNLLEFEARKVVSRIFRNLLIRQIGTRYPTVNHIAENKEIIFYLLEGYDHKDGEWLWNELFRISSFSISGSVLECYITSSASLPIEPHSVLVWVASARPVIINLIKLNIYTNIKFWHHFLLSLELGLISKKGRDKVSAQFYKDHDVCVWSCKNVFWPKYNQQSAVSNGVSAHRQRKVHLNNVARYI